jgi:cyanophycinase
LQTEYSPNGKHVDDLEALLGAWRTPGYLMIIGGADRLDPESRLARLFYALAQRAEANSDLSGLVLVSTATRHPEILTGEYMRIFARIGVPPDKIHAPFIRNRDEALEERHTRLLSGAGGIFITGGDQYTLAQTLDRSPVEEAIMAAYSRGAVVAGTSAGATAMGRPMIVAGGGSGEFKMGIVQMSHGLGWVGDDVIIDTHFGARGRFPRLASAVAEHPAALGVGIDENTCLLLDPEWQGRVAGAGVIYFIDASHLVLNSVDTAHTGQPVSAGPFQVDVLAAGQRYDLRSRRVVVAAEAKRRV